MEKTTNNQKAANSLMRFYDALRAVPAEAKKPIKDGRLKGKTDVNPMWRIKRLTELFGPVGFGWKYTITKMWTEEGSADTVAAFVNVDLFVKDPATGAWSEAIPGTGGNVFKRKESSGNLYVDDDCYKKALTDAISIAGKALGLAADVFFEQDQSKYADGSTGATTSATQQGATQQRPVTNRPTTQQPTTTAKPALTPQSPYWNSSIATAMGTSDTPDNIRLRIEKKFTITNQDFFALMQAAGKPIAVPAGAPAIDSDDLPF